MYIAAFWSAIAFVIIGACFGIAGIWCKDFWKSELGLQLLLTDIVLGVTAIVVALITRWMGDS